MKRRRITKRKPILRIKTRRGRATSRKKMIWGGWWGGETMLVSRAEGIEAHPRLEGGEGRWGGRV